MSTRRSLAVASVACVAFLAAVPAFAAREGDSGGDPAEGGTTKAYRQEGSGKVVGRGAPTCTSGRTVVGSDSGAIRFIVECWGPAKGALVGFSLSRQGFQRMSRHPVIIGAEAEKRYGFCDRRRVEIIDCEARIHGKVTIEGEVEVSPAGRCSSDISISVVEPSRCTDRDCPSGVVTRQLTAGIPRGC